MSIKLLYCRFDTLNKWQGLPSLWHRPVRSQLCGYRSMLLHVFCKGSSTRTTIVREWAPMDLIDPFVLLCIQCAHINIYIYIYILHMYYYTVIHTYVYIYITNIYIYIHVCVRVLINQRHFSVPLRPLVTSKSNPLFSGWLHLRIKCSSGLLAIPEKDFKKLFVSTLASQRNKIRMPIYAHAASACQWFNLFHSRPKVDRVVSLENSKVSWHISLMPSCNPVGNLNSTKDIQRLPTTGLYPLVPQASTGNANSKRRLTSISPFNMGNLGFNTCPSSKKTQHLHSWGGEKKKHPAVPLS